MLLLRQRLPYFCYLAEAPRRRHGKALEPFKKLTPRLTTKPGTKFVARRTRLVIVKLSERLTADPIAARLKSPWIPSCGDITLRCTKNHRLPLAYGRGDIISTEVEAIPMP